MRKTSSVTQCLRGLFLCVALCLSGGTAGAQAHWPTEGPPRPLSARNVNFPPYEVQTLPNGLQVVAVLQHEEPAVSMRLLVRAGSASDPKGKLGLARLSASLIDQGTTTRSAQELADAIDFIGGAMGAGAGTDLSYVNMLVMKDSFESGMRMLSDMARNPAYAPEEIDRQKQQTLSGLQVSAQDPDYIANAVFDRLVYGFHPYGLPQTGTIESLSGITRDDLRAFHERYFTPNNSILAIVGDVTAEEAFATAKKVFADWPSHDVVPEKYIDPPDPTRRVVVVNKPDAVQTEIRVGHVGIQRKHPDYMALNLAIRILGGEGSNRLHQVLRTERGLTYGAQADMDTLEKSGDIEAETNTRTEATGEVVRLIVDEFSRLQRERVGERELENAKAYMTGSFPLTIETPDQIAMQVLNVVFYGLPLEDLQNFRDRVNAVTVDDIQRVARTYLKPDRLSIVLVGDAQAFSTQLKGIGLPQFETVDADNLDLTALNFQRAKRAIAGPPVGAFAARTVGIAAQDHVVVLQDFSPAFSYQPASQSSTGLADTVRTQALLDRVIAAKGGLDRLKALKTIKAITKATATTQGGPVEVETTTYIQYPNRVHVEMKLPDGNQVQVFDGQHAWVRDPAGIHDIPDAGVKAMDATLRRDIISALLAAHDGTLHARAMPDAKDESGVVRHVLELSAAGMDPFILYIDPSTNLIAKETYVAGGPQRPLIEEVYSDYRSVDGIQVAFDAVIRQGGRQVVDRRVTAFTINTQLDPALFKRPTA
jgi:zinc protease